MLRSLLILTTILVQTIQACGSNESKGGAEANASQFSRVRIIREPYLQYYPGVEPFWNSAYQKLDTMTIFRNQNISILIDHSPFDPEKGVVRPEKRRIFLFSSNTDSIYLVPQYDTLVFGESRGDSVYASLLRKTSNSLSKITVFEDQYYQESNHCLVTSIAYKKPGAEESELTLDTIRIFFEPEYEHIPYSISPYYDSIGHGKVMRIEYQARPFYSNTLKRKVNGFTFFEKMDYIDKVTDSEELKFIRWVEERVAMYKAGRMRLNFSAD